MQTFVTLFPFSFAYCKILCKQMYGMPSGTVSTTQLFISKNLDGIKKDCRPKLEGHNYIWSACWISLIFP